MDYYTNEHPSITWKLDDSMQELSERLVWSMSVRQRHPWEIDTFLRILKEHGSCTVVVEDPRGEVMYFPCHISTHQLALGSAA